MSQSKAVEPATLELIKSLQDKKYLEGFYLVGVTALAYISIIGSQRILTFLRIPILMLP